MIAKKEFFKKYNISQDDFEKTKLKWEEVVSIHDAYENRIKTLGPCLNFFAERLRTAPCVHSIKARLKEPEHVAEKIIREKRINPSLEITVENYPMVITDIIGLRALHLFKEEWESIHDWITKSWELKGKPVIYTRKGDKLPFGELFEKKGCEVEIHPFGYRSVHYLVGSKPSKEEIVAEIQVRTIFEEGWSEIDHLIRYPYVKDNPILEQYLVMFNRLAGSADEMGSYIRYLDSALKTKELEFRKAVEDGSSKMKGLRKKIGKLESEIEKMKIEEKDKSSIGRSLGRISDITESLPGIPNIISPLVLDQQEELPSLLSNLSAQPFSMSQSRVDLPSHLIFDNRNGPLELQSASPTKTDEVGDRKAKKKKPKKKKPKKKKPKKKAAKSTSKKTTAKKKRKR